VRLAVVAAVFPAIFIGELPDKTMFAALVMSSRGRPLSVWLGAAAAFLVHVVIAVSIGVALFSVLPHRVVDVVVGALFAVSAAVAFVAAFTAEVHEERIVAQHRARRVFGTAFVVIFLAEWGDLTQVLTANLAVRYHSALSVGIGATAGLWAVSGLAVVGGHGLLARLPTRPLRLATGVVLAGLAVVELVAATR
jgi:Ca2+/H+ antiporter, TMEM165/GDT1 family